MLKSAVGALEKTGSRFSRKRSGLDRIVQTIMRFVFSGRSENKPRFLPRRISVLTQKFTGRLKPLSISLPSCGHEGKRFIA